MLRTFCSLQHNTRHSRGLRFGSNTTFQDLGILPSICQRLELKFPNIREPTLTQKALVPAILQERDVLLRDFTGSGKTFGIVLALLTQAQQSDIKHSRLVLVPNLDLAVQVVRWTRALADDPDKSIQLIQEDVPINDSLMLVSTPASFYRNPVELTQVRTLFVDELDRVVDPPPKYMTRKQQRNRSKHTPLGQKLVDEVMNVKSEIKPQFIGSSATLNAPTRNMVKVKNWANDGLFLDIRPSASVATIQHHALVIEPDNSIRNLRSESTASQHKETELTPSIHLDAVANAYKLLASHRAILFLHSTASVNAAVEELISTHGLSAISLAELDESLIASNRPMLLVTTEHAARGLDIALGDVFIALQTDEPPTTGKPTDANSYIHMAGRVGRVGRQGRVITFLRRLPDEKGIDEAMHLILRHVDAKFDKLDIVAE